MDWVSALISGGFDLLGGGLNAIYSSASAKKQYEYNLALQNDAQRHQINMYKHQNQWRVNDLRAAGLNPILSTHAASSMPSAGMNSVSMPNSANFDFKEASKAFTRALFKRGQKENELLDAQINSAKSQVEANLSLAEKYASEAFNTDLNSAFDYSRDMLNLRKRKLFNEGTPDLYKGFGLFKEELDKFNNYKPWDIYDKGGNVWDMSNSPRRTGRDRFFYKK